MQQQFVPVVTSAAGSCLTMANWQQLGITLGAFYLDVLLMKPGLQVLQSIGSLRDYYQWPGEIVLHVNLSTTKDDDLYQVRSQYDGELITIDSHSLLALISRLKPQYVFFSANMRATFHAMGLLPKESIVLSAEDYTVEGSQALAGALLESDKPAAEGMAGLLYTHDGVINILDPRYSEQFIPLSAACACPTCTQPFTRAYLHHLLLHTPLLAQRYLIQHNVFYRQTMWQSSATT